MIPSDLHIGIKIRALRQNRGLTQRELAGDRITRNMLSLIESGNASPSVSTILYLAERLDTPVGYFFTFTEEDEESFLKMSVISAMKECFRQKNYRECQEIFSTSSLHTPDDEAAYLLAMSAFYTAEEAAQVGDLPSALRDLDRSERFAKLSAYCTQGFLRGIQYHRILLSSPCAEEIPDILSDLSYSGEYVPHTVVLYFAALKLSSRIEGGSLPFPRGSYFERHMNARKSLADDKSADALKRLRELSLDPNLPFYMQYRVLSDLEEAANKLGDFSTAYSSARRRLELITKYRL